MGTRTVYQQLRTVALQVPANTPDTAPLTFAWDLGDSTLEHLDVTFTQGAAFLCGAHAKLAQQIIVPWGSTSNTSTDAWIIGSGETVRVPVAVDVDGGIQIEAYNLDPINFHTLFFRAYVVANTLAQAGGDNTGTAVVAVSSSGGGGASTGQQNAAQTAELVDQLAAGVG